MKNRIKSPNVGSFSYIARIIEERYNEHKNQDHVRGRMKRGTDNGRKID